MKTRDQISASQLRALCAMLLLSPALRFCPGASIAAAGRAAWLSMLAALPPLLAYAVFLRRFLSCRGEGEGLAELCLRAAGEKGGKPLLLGMALWLSFYAGFVLRAGAERFITTIYPHAGPAFFVAALGLAAALAALGPARTLARTAGLVRPLLVGALAIILLTALSSSQKENLLPVTARELRPLLAGSLPAVDVLLAALTLAAFFSGLLPEGAGGFRPWARWLLGAVGFLCLLNAAILGNFGAELAARLTRPFFYLVRNLVFFRSVERVEALMVALWVFPDFLLAAAALFAAQLCLRRAFGRASVWQGEKLFALGHGRWMIPLCSLAAIAAALWMAPDQKSFLFLSDRLVPALNLSFSLLVLPALYIIGNKKQRL